MIQPRAASQVTWDERTAVHFVTLKNRSTGEFLNLDGSGFTPNRAIAYRGTPIQAAKMRATNPLAKRLSIIRFQPAQ